MYTYIVDRTQIYLSQQQAAALDREARRRGQTRSHLIREAIDQAYQADIRRESFLEALDTASGAWSGRAETGEQYVERIRAADRWWDRLADRPAEEDGEA